MANFDLDVKGEVCPYATVKTKKFVNSKMSSGDQVCVILDYPLSSEEIPRWATEAGHKVVSVDKDGDAVWKITIQKG
ncbi:MAG: sulfurtransferase TusA family protein [Nitrospirae bacterium]|nr:sulfurtransferase TusA family protein [Nitrospirota bacterium]MBI5695257.1 sulfurtransferase TusA family protein [Nitrospirota bacterium]